MSYDSTIWLSSNADTEWLRFFSWILVNSAIITESQNNNIISIPSTTELLWLFILKSANHRFLSLTFCFHYLLSKIQDSCYYDCSSCFLHISLWFIDAFTLTRTVLSLSHCDNIILKCAIWASRKMLFNNGKLSFSFFCLHVLQLIVSKLFSALLNCPFQTPKNM